MYATSVIFKCKTARLIEIFQLCQVRDQCSISMWSQRMIEPKTLGGWCYLLVIIIDVTPLSHVGKATLMIRCDLKATQDKLKHKRSPFLSESMLLFFLFNVSILFKESQNITKQKHMQFFYIIRPGCSLYLLSFLVVIGISFAVLTQLSPQPSLGTFGYLKQAHPFLQGFWCCVDMNQIECPSEIFDVLFFQCLSDQRQMFWLSGSIGYLHCEDCKVMSMV